MSRMCAGLLASVAISAFSPAFAQTQTRDDASSQEIIVTGSKQTTTLQESDLSVTVLDAETIKDARLRDVRRLDDLVPNVQFNELGQLSSVRDGSRRRVKSLHRQTRCDLH